MKNYVFTVATLFSCYLQAQSTLGVIDAEKRFARMALDSGLRTAFLNNLDSNGVIFNGGQILNGIHQYSSVKEQGIKLLWTPAFAALSGSNDVGFTTGPYEVRKTMNSPVLAAGQYSTIWKKNSIGEWKVLVDLGTEYGPSLFDSTLTAVAFSHLIPATDFPDYQMLDAAFIKAYTEKNTAGYETFLHDATWLNMPNHHPFTSVTADTNTSKNIPKNLSFYQIAGGMAAAKDLAFMYGNLRLGEKEGNYLRVWGNTKKGWILLLQTLNW